MLEEKIEQTQKRLKELGLDGWLFYDFRGSNPFARRYFESDPFLTRRFFYWIPAQGKPVSLISALEVDALTLPGEKRSYRIWQELHEALQRFLKPKMKVAMEVSSNPYLSLVDAGTVDQLRTFGIELFSSGDLLTEPLNQAQIDSHLAAAQFLDATVAKAWDFIKEGITESQVSAFISNEFEAHGYVSEEMPICAVNAHSANPHYQPKNGSAIKPGDFILIDLWCKQDKPDAVYADITRVGVFGSKPTPKQQGIFSIVKEARDAATELVKQRFAAAEPITGAEVDRLARTIIGDHGYGEFFIHRLGHNIDTQDHGSGPHLDSYETEDNRQLMAGTCFSIEPGIYLPGEFGVRLEYDVLVYPDGRVQVTGGIQNEI